MEGHPVKAHLAAVPSPLNNIGLEIQIERKGKQLDLHPIANSTDTEWKPFVLRVRNLL